MEADKLQATVTSGQAKKSAAIAADLPVAKGHMFDVRRRQRFSGHAQLWNSSRLRVINVASMMLRSVSALN